MFIYVVTIVTIVATNLLTGVLVGLGLSLLKLLYVFSPSRGAQGGECREE